MTAVKAGFLGFPKPAPSPLVIPGMVKLETGGAVGVATLDVPLAMYANYAHKAFLLFEFKPATADASLYMRLSGNGGATYDAGGSDYSQSNNGGADAARAELDIMTGTGTAAERSGTAFLILPNTNSNTTRQLVMWLSVALATATLGSRHGGGSRAAIERTNAVRFFANSGNMSMKYELYGFN